MSAITVHPENAQQLEKLKNILKELKIPFENQEEIKDKALLNSLEKGLAQSSKNEVIDFQEFKQTFLYS